MSDKQRELDPVDLVRELNSQSDLGLWPHVQRSQSGGSARVQPEDVIGSGTCWCGQPYDHDWPLKQDGAPHPRYPI